ncbi:MBL fold metallo-hydrolase [Nakamurella sp. YIM 132087]|uniref:MBL fold metallo-hydrolase n=2 Tax=Nakamurella alba TaxID=2665158 RepID=A0A7K1FPD5_9ACTN|nr:MBL fold metallo-hydrolase [Nakamurella alba]
MPQDGLRAVNVYAISDGDELVMIDGGWDVPAARAAMLEGIETLGATPADVSAYLVTHHHSDHFTLATAMRREFGIPVALGEGERDGSTIATTPVIDGLFSQIKHLLLMGAPELATEISAGGADPYEDRFRVWEPPDSWLADGQVIEVGRRRITVIATPGHTSGHVVFHEPATGLLFTGDHVLPTITPSLAFDGVRAEHPLRDFLGSLALLRELPDTVMMPAHGEPGGSVHTRVDELLEHHRERLDRTAEAVADGADTGAAVAGRLTWTRRHHRLDELDLLNRMLAISETGAHLDVLVQQGRISQDQHRGVLHFSPA